MCVIPDEDPNHSISLDTDDEEGYPFDHMGDGVGDEDDGGEDEGQELGSENAARLKRQPLPPVVKDQYEKHLKYLRQTPHGSKPYLYEVHQTFWLPHQANFFILNRPNKPRPSQLYNYRWFYWDPDHLVEGGLKCPNCCAHLHRHGYTQPRRVVDLQNVFYMIGQRHRCPQCKNPKSNEKTITFNSWDPRILERLPHALAAEFPACLSHRNAISDLALAVMRTCFQYGMGSKQFSNCLQVLHYRHFDIIHAQYLDGILSHKCDSDPSNVYLPFGTFEDKHGYCGFVPSSLWLRQMYDKLIEDHGTQIDQKTAMCSGEICAIDHSHKITKQIVKVNGETVFSATLTVTNEFGEVRVLAFVATKSHAQFESALLKMKASLDMYGHKQPQIFYTDNPTADKQFLEHVFPSLTENVIPVEKYPNLKPIDLPCDVQKSPQSSASGIQEAIAKITVDLNVENSTSQIVVGFDAEWNVDLGQSGNGRPTAIIQIAYQKWVHILQVCDLDKNLQQYSKKISMQISQFKGKLPTALLSFLQNPQILKAGRNVTQDLKRLEKECISHIPFAGAVELAQLAKARGVVSDARVGLADLCAAVLHARLDKSTPLRVSTDWDNAQLSPEQIHYAALDAWVSLQIYHRLSQIPLPGLITESTLPGTPVSVLQDDGQVIAHGVLSQETPALTCRGVNHTPTRAQVTIQHIFMPGAILPLHKTSLASLGPTPFDVLVRKSKLHTRSGCSIQFHPDSLLSTSSPTLTHSVQPIHDEVLQFLSKPISADEDWTEGLDDPVEGVGEMDINTSEADRLSLEEGVALLHEISSNPSVWPAAIRSRVLMDVWHAMARIKVSKEHGLRRPFARALRDAILIPDAADKSHVSEYLASIGTSWNDVLCTNARWLWKHCKRTIPPPEELYPLVKEVYSTFGPLLDAKTRQPLFNSRAWKDAGNVLKAIKMGLLSDPPGIPLYFQIGIDKKHGNLPIYRCARGTNNAEGGVHHSGRRHLPISGVSAFHASARLRDFVLMHNLVVSQVEFAQEWYL
jgi:hypothetical protein